MRRRKPSSYRRGLSGNNASQYRTRRRAKGDTDGDIVEGRAQAYAQCNPQSHVSTHCHARILESVTFSRNTGKKQCTNGGPGPVRPQPREAREDGQIK
jgi:hypothetical protein